MSEQEPFYDEFDSNFWLVLSASVFAFLGLIVRATLKSRCKEFHCCGMSCIRDVAPPGMEPEIDESESRREPVRPPASNAV